jgi:hypothetical protein
MFFLFEKTPLSVGHATIARGPIDGSATTLERLEGTLEFATTSGDVGSGLPIVFPPHSDTNPQEADDIFPPCGTLFLGAEEPVLRLRVSNYINHILPPWRYSIASMNGFPPRTIDFFEIDDRIVFTESKGGRPDESASLIDVCQLSCEEAGGTQQERED